MEKNVTPIAAPADLSKLRAGVVDASTRAYGAMTRYAAGLTATFGTSWYNLPNGDKSELGKKVQAEKDEFYAALKKAKHSNPSVIWARVKQYAKEAVEGKPEKGEGEDGDGKGSTETRERRTMLRRYVEELSALYVAGKKAEKLEPKVQDALGHVGNALMALGVDLTMLMAGK